MSLELFRLKKIYRATATTQAKILIEFEMITAW